MRVAQPRRPVAEGIVPGGGLALLRCAQALADEESKCEGDERTGVQILCRAILVEAGIIDPTKIVRVGERRVGRQRPAAD
jgi:chaperonin GroEL